jgi:hypothetical protein
MRLTVGSLPAAVYWRRRAVVAVAVLLVVILFASMCGGPDSGQPGAQPTPGGSSSTTPTGSPELTDGPGGTGPGGTPGGDGAVSSPTATAANQPGASAGPPGGGTADGGDDGATGGEDGGGPVGPPVVASVPCGDAEIALTATASPSPGIYGGVITLTLVVRNTADHPCLRDVGSAPQELQVRRGSTVLWSSDHCGTPQTSDVRAFGPNIESRFSRRWNTYRVAPHECELPSGALPASTGPYQVVARLGDKLSDPFPFEIHE